NLQQAQALSTKHQRPIADWGQICQALPEVRSHAPERLVATIAHQWWKALNEVTTHGFKALTSRYEQVDYLSQIPVNITDEGLIINQGIAVGINGQGQLLIQSGADTQAISVGEVSVRLQAQDDL